MAVYHYVALDAVGNRRKGVLDGDHPRQIRTLLREQGLMPVEVEEVRQREQRSGQKRIVQRISGRALALMTRQLSTMLRAGVPLEESLQTVAQQTEDARVRSIVLSLRAQVSEGQSLAAAMRGFARIFPEDYIATVSAGEHTGRLEVILERLADHTETRDELQQKVVAALIYPALLTLTSLAIVTGLLVYVVPQVVRVFDSFGGELPLLTRILISISDFMRNGGIYILLAAGVFFIVVMPLLLRNEKRRFIWHRWVLRMPLFGRLAVGVNTARFTRTLSILIASGVPLLEAFHVAAAVLSNLPMRAAVVEAAARVREGAGIFHSLNKTKFFPPMTLHLIASGESSGRLEEMLERAAHALEREQESWLTTLVRILEPAMILIMGGVVLVIVLAIMLPIFQMNKMIG